MGNEAGEAGSHGEDGAQPARRRWRVSTWREQQALRQKQQGAHPHQARHQVGVHDAKQHKPQKHPDQGTGHQEFQQRQVVASTVRIQAQNIQHKQHGHQNGCCLRHGHGQRNERHRQGAKP